MKASTRREILVVGDLIALSLFVPLGARNHNEGLSLAVITRNLLPVAFSWLVVAIILRTYFRHGFRWVLINWAVAIPLAIAVRGIAVGRLLTSATLIFLGIAMAVTLTLLLSWRLLAYLVARFAGWLPERSGGAIAAGVDPESAGAGAGAVESIDGVGLGAVESTDGVGQQADSR